MYRYAQIVNDKVHYIFDHEQPLDILRQDYFAPSIVIIDITNDTLGIEEGWNCIDGVVSKPDITPNKEALIQQLNAKYTPLFGQSASSFAIALMDNDIALQDELKQERIDLKSAYESELAVIENG